MIDRRVDTELRARLNETAGRLAAGLIGEYHDDVSSAWAAVREVYRADLFAARIELAEARAEIVRLEHALRCAVGAA